MSIYQKLLELGSKFVGKHLLFKYGINLSPMYRRTTAKVLDISKDLLCVKIKLPISYKNKNYVNTIFGGSMFAAVDPIPMVQLINLLGDDYIVWDKSAQIFFKRPARENLYADSICTINELDEIRKKVQEQHETEVIKTISLTDKHQTHVFCQIRKHIYIADKTYYKQKTKMRMQNSPKS